MKTNELTGPALDWAVVKCEGMDAAMLNDFEDGTWLYWHRKYSTDWAQGGPIIEREIDQLTRSRISNPRLSIYPLGGALSWITLLVDLPTARKPMAPPLSSPPCAAIVVLN